MDESPGLDAYWRYDVVWKIIDSKHVFYTLFDTKCYIMCTYQYTHILPLHFFPEPSGLELI